MNRVGLVCLGVLWLGLSAWCQPAVGIAKPITDIALQGVEVGSPESIRVLLQPLVGTQPSAEQLQNAFRAVAEWYRQRGYTLAQVASYEQDAEGRLLVEIAEGTIEAIEVQGNRRTRASVLRHLIGVKPGAVYNERHLQRVRQRLGRFPFLREAQLGPEPGSAPGTTCLVLQVEEERSLDVAIAAATPAMRALSAMPSCRNRMLPGWGIAPACSGNANKCVTLTRGRPHPCVLPMH
jgi:hemolysin activation/secretion protein